MEPCRGDTSIHGNLSVLGTLTVNAVSLSDQLAALQALQAQVQALAGLPSTVSTLQAQVASLQKSVNGLAGLSTDIFTMKGQISNLQNERRLEFTAEPD
jgi:prefoldin subunit 5